MHQSENSQSLTIESSFESFIDYVLPNSCVGLVLLPFYKTIETISNRERLFSDLNKFLDNADDNATIAILSSPIFAADFSAQISRFINLKLWIAVKLEEGIKNQSYLTEEHCALLIFTKYSGSLKHTKTRIGYSYCPCCNKTTKDYGGKKHLYHEFGTLMSDVWRDISVNFESYPTQLILRLTDLFGIDLYSRLIVFDERDHFKPSNNLNNYLNYSNLYENSIQESQLLNGDCLKELKNIPDNSIDFCFADPPYNLNKNYENWNDGIAIQEYFNWCDLWLSELGRVLKPGRTLAVLNIPQWCVRHFKHLITILDYQDWIVWEGLSMPVRMIMPSHYSILCFSKGKPRKLPSIDRNNSSLLELRSLKQLRENFCVRPSCISLRKKMQIIDTKDSTNLWPDIHRLKHNSRRVDHPCQLPPMFMYRLISMFTSEFEVVLDPFNGAGTTTLTAHQLNRKYVGIELSEYYHNITINRHIELTNGLDPFRKVHDDKPKAKNSPVERVVKQNYQVSKKVLQLEIKKIAVKLGHIPNKEEVRINSNYPIEYFENYFINWGEATAAARTTGMNENKTDAPIVYRISENQLKLFEDRIAYYGVLKNRKNIPFSAFKKNTLKKISS